MASYIAARGRVHRTDRLPVLACSILCLLGFFTPGRLCCQFCGGRERGVAGKTHLPCTWMPYHSSISSHLACISAAPARLDICRGMHQETHSAFGGTSIRPWHVQPDISYAYVCVMYAICDLDSRRARWYNTVWRWAYKDGTIRRTTHLA